MNDVVQVNPGVNTDLVFKNEAEVKTYFTDAIKKQLAGKKILFGVGALVGLAVLMPIVWAAVSAGLGLAALATLLVSAGVAWKWIPNLFLRVENRVREANQREQNRHLAALKAEARQNPIETLQSEYLAMDGQRAGISKANAAFLAATQAYKDELRENKRHDTTVDYTEEERTAAEMQRVCDEQARDLAEFVRALAAFKKKIDEAQRKWNLALKANAAFALLDAAEQSSKMRDILVQVSFDEVRQQYSGLFAKMNVRATELSAARTLRLGHSVVDVSTIEVPVIKEKDRVAVN